MSDSESQANELRLLEEKRFTVGLTPDEEARVAELSAVVAPWGGFDVNAAAAEVRAEIDPASATGYDPNAWAGAADAAQGYDPGAYAPAAADPAAYGLDPNDPNAAAWAAWYAEQGWTPADVAAHWAQYAQAEGAAQQDEAAPPHDAAAAARDAASAAETAPWEQDQGYAFEEDAAAIAAPGAPAPADVSLDAPWGAPEASLAATWDAPVATPSYAPDGEVAEAPAPVEGATSMWDLGARSAALGAAQPASPEFQHVTPAGWPGDQGTDLFDDFQLASGGSFSEGLAPPAAPAAASPELPPFELGAPAARAEVASADVPIDLPLGDELDGVAGTAVAAPEPAAAQPAIPLPALDLDLQAQGEGASPPDLGSWMDHAVPHGDHAVDFAAFEAEPHEPGAPDPLADATAMWGLPAASPPEPPALELGPRDREPGTLDEPAPEPWSEASIASPGEFLAFAAAAAEAADAPPGGLPEPPGELAEITDADIIEVGTDVVEVPPVAEPSPLDELEPPAYEATPFPEPANEPPVAEPLAFEPTGDAFAAPAGSLEPLPDVPVNLDLTPAPFALAALGEPPIAPPAAEWQQDAEPPQDPEPERYAGPPQDLPPQQDADIPQFADLQPEPEPPPRPEPSSYVIGTHRVVIHTSDGQVKRGSVSDLTLDAPEVLLAPQAGGALEPLAADHIKAIFFMLPAGAQPPSPQGKKVRVTFRDGRQVAGYSPDYDPQRVGFFMIPADTRTHTARIWVYRSSVRQVSVS